MKTKTAMHFKLKYIFLILEMESMEHKSVQLNALQLQKNELKQELFTLQSELKGVLDITCCGNYFCLDKWF